MQHAAATANDQHGSRFIHQNLEWEMVFSSSASTSTSPNRSKHSLPAAFDGPKKHSGQAAAANPSRVGRPALSASIRSCCSASSVTERDTANCSQLDLDVIAVVWVRLYQQQETRTNGCPS
uniref:(northern house mosquito) hypothetical protein n=1 Tax=Culex pipiens TaxID=7175 RepID=A0A8D8CWP8_CULPI